MVVPGRALTAAPGTTLFDEATCGWRLEIWQHVYTHRRGVATRVSPLQLPVPGSTSGTNAVRREAASRAVWGSTPATEGRMGKREGTRARAGPGTKRDPSQHEHVGGHRSPHCCICVCSVRCAVFCRCLRRCTGSAPASCVRLKPRDLLSQVFSFYLLRKPFSVEYRLDLPSLLPFFCLSLHDEHPLRRDRRGDPAASGRQRCRRRESRITARTRRAEYPRSRDV